MSLERTSSIIPRRQGTVFQGSFYGSIGRGLRTINLDDSHMIGTPDLFQVARSFSQEVKRVNVNN